MHLRAGAPALRARHGTFSRFLWGFVGGRPKVNRWRRPADVPAQTPEAREMSKALKGAVVRILSLPYHKVLESKLTDAEGRYSFHVGPGEYYLIALKPGYGKTETDPIDFTKIDKPAWVASDLPMRRSLEAGKGPSGQV